VVITPSGATLRPGDALPLSAVALAGNGQAIPDATFTWRSSRSGVVSLNGATATAGQPGTAKVIATSGGKRAFINVTVRPSLPPGGKNPSYVAAALGQVNHILADGDWVYWSEADRERVRIRKTPREGGPIFDLASEPRQTARGLSVAYVHLRLIGDTLFWSRQSLGFLDHWSIRSVPVSGGPAAVVLGEDISVEPFPASAWGVSGKYLVASLRRPEELGLSESTEIAALDTQSGAWSPLIQGQFRDHRHHVLAAELGAVYIGGVTEGDQSRILRMAPDAAPNAFQTLLDVSGNDGGFRENGATDGANLFFWSNRTGTRRLLSLPTGGGTPSALVSNLTAGGLAVEGSNLFAFRRQSQLIRIPSSGGPPTQLLTRLLRQSTFGPAAVSGGRVFVARVEKGKVNIISVPAS
jgi:hypothetical protein